MQSAEEKGVQNAECRVQSWKVVGDGTPDIPKTKGYRTQRRFASLKYTITVNEERAICVSPLQISYNSALCTFFSPLANAVKICYNNR